jgi:hypothetical protein
MPDAGAREFLEALFPVPFDELGCKRTPRLAVWSKTPKHRANPGASRTDWATDVAQAAAFAAERRATADVYYGVVLQDYDALLADARHVKGADYPDRALRGGTATTAVLPALWVDLDVGTDGHTATDYPPDEEAALALLEAVPVPPTCRVRTGGGFHVYWFLREPWVLADGGERERARALVQRVQWAVRRQAEARGWSLDGTGDMARVLRLPGTLNHKLLNSRPVEVDYLAPAPEARYAVSDFDVLEPPPGAGRARTGSADQAKADPKPRDEGPPATFQPIHDGCSWLRWCHEHRKEVKQNHWYAALTIVGRCATTDPDGTPVSGRELAHRMSRGHPKYTPAETDEYYERALVQKPDVWGPRTCDEIAGVLGAYKDHCSKCPHWERIKSPIVLGRGRRFSRRKSPLGPPVSKGGKERQEGGGGGRGGGPKDGGRARKGGRGGRIQIRLSHLENEVADQALRALAVRERNLFQRGTALVQVVRSDEAGHRPLHRPPEAPAARQVQEARMRELVATHCEFLAARAGRGGDVDWLPAHPPRWLPRALLDRFRWPGLQKLEGVVEGPVLRADGSVLQKPGYDRKSGLFYSPGQRFAAVPAKPDRDRVDDALERLREAVCDFPFEEEVHFAGWLTSLLTPLARFAFKGPSPLNLIDANVRGAGKSLLADVVHMIVSGRPAPRMTYLRDESELRKAITTIALKARQMVLIDNVRGSFGTPTLDLALTSTIWEDRLLGQNVEVELPLLVTWTVTGNNIELRGDISRRCVHIRLDSPEERPERRSGFRHPRLLDWLERQRHQLLPAALTLLVGYCAEGRPDQGLRPWGSYESWSDLVRATVVWLGLPDPAVAAEGLQSRSDVEQLASANLVRGLDELLAPRGGRATASEILHDLEAAKREERLPELFEAIEELFPRLRPGELPSTAQLGSKLRGLRGRNFGGRAVHGRRSNRGVVWTTEPSPASDPSPPSPLPHPPSAPSPGEGRHLPPSEEEKEGKKDGEEGGDES